MMPVPLHPSLAGGRSEKNILGDLDCELAFSVGEYERRIEQVRSGMLEIRVDLFITREPSDVMYLSGFQTFAVFGGETVIVSLKEDPILVVHPPELGMALLHTWFGDVFGYEEGKRHESYLAELISNIGLEDSRIAVDKYQLGFTVSEYEDLAESLPGAEIIDGSYLVSSVRKIKANEEIEHLRRAAGITDQGIKAAIDAVELNNTDNDVAAAANQALVANGSEYSSLAPIVTTGRRSGILHSNHKRNQLKHGDVILLEMGASYQRYTSPIMRTVTIGKPSREVQVTVDACLTALNNVINTIRPGVSVDEVAKAGWEGINKAGPGMVFHGVFGYAVGGSLPPGWADGTAMIRLGLETILEPGMVFHHPVALRRLGYYGIAFSETTVVTDAGCEVLTKFERKLYVK